MNRRGFLGTLAAMFAAVKLKVKAAPIYVNGKRGLYKWEPTETQKRFAAHYGLNIDTEQAAR